MSFSRDAKLQILKQPITDDCCGLAFFGGLLHVSGEWDPQTKTMSILTDISQIYDFCNKILNQLYGEFAELEIEDDLKINKTRYYRITLPKENIFNMLKDFGLMNSLGEYSYSKIDEYITKDGCCKKSFIKGVFLGCATSGIKISEKTNERTSSGYDIEFVSYSHDFLIEFASLLTEFNILPKIIKRKKHYVLYIKESSQVSDLLAIVGAFDSVLQLQNELALRELRNKVNRQTNCLNANITKTVEASIKQNEAIEIISETLGLELLPMDLQEVALLRLANPEESLGELLKLSNLKLTKSGLNHRLNKIIKIAKELG
ncbi:MAG: DNA-binding protein WhiA [Clostridia bacterium]|nr:DNA-binding protein WhiA [Clostridia bacterium]